MAQSKVGQNVIRFKCSSCGRVNYYTRKNKKKLEGKLELQKYCKWERSHKIHKEARK